MTSWPIRLRHAVRLGIAPEAFWRLSWREWAALTATPALTALDRAGLDDLMRQFPDKTP